MTLVRKNWNVETGSVCVTNCAPLAFSGSVTKNRSPEGLQTLVTPFIIVLRSLALSLWRIVTSQRCDVTFLVVVFQASICNSTVLRSIIILKACFLVYASYEVNNKFTIDVLLRSTGCKKRAGEGIRGLAISSWSHRSWEICTRLNLMLQATNLLLHAPMIIITRKPIVTITGFRLTMCICCGQKEPD